jgi:hypothetical protein
MIFAQNLCRPTEFSVVQQKLKHFNFVSSNSNVVGRHKNRASSKHPIKQIQFCKIIFFAQVKDLRNRADEGARNKVMYENQGIVYTVPLAGQHLEHLLNSIAALYGDDSLGLSLMLEFWCPTSGESANERFPARQLALSKFVRLTGDLLMPSLYRPYIEMLVSLSGHPQAALHCFNLLKANVGSSTVSWDHFFCSLHQEQIRSKVIFGQKYFLFFVVFLSHPLHYLWWFYFPSSNFNYYYKLQFFDS